jgi:hypothetical protein
MFVVHFTACNLNGLPSKAGPPRSSPNGQDKRNTGGPSFRTVAATKSYAREAENPDHGLKQSRDKEYKPIVHSFALTFCR